MRSVGVGILGLGRVAQDVHVVAVQETAGLELRGVADATPALRQKFSARLTCPIHADLGGLLDQDDIDLVIVATPSGFHHDHVMDSLRARKHVMVEKPMAASLDQAREMATEARRRNLLLTVHHNRRYDGDFLMLKRLVSEGRAGTLVSVDVRFQDGNWPEQYPAREYRPGWRLERAFGGGNLLDWAPHFVDQLVQLLGSAPISVTAWLRSARWSAEVDDFFRAVLVWPDGILGFVEASSISPHPLPHWSVVGSVATISQQRWGDPLVVTNLDGEVEEIPELARRSRRIFDNLAAAILGSEDLDVTLEQCLLTSEVIEAARISHETGATVDLPLASKPTQ